MTEEFDPDTFYPEVRDCLHQIAIALDTLNRHMLHILRTLDKLREIEEERDGN